MFKVVWIDEAVHPQILKLFPADWKLVYATDNLSPHQMQEIEALFVYAHPIVDGAFMDQMPNLRIVANFGVGVPHINVSEVRGRGIPVTNTPGVLQHATADLTAGLILAVTRRIAEGHIFATGPDFNCYDPHKFWGLELRGAALGIIGMGQIGTEVARRMHHGFGMRILYHNRRPVSSDTRDELDALILSKDELLALSDVVVLTTTLTGETKGMIGARELTLMKSGSYLVNVSRGGVVDHVALTEALQSHLGGAALDVTEPEPLPRDHPLLSMSNVVITPHVGSATLATRLAMGQKTIANILAVFAGKPPLNPVS